MHFISRISDRASVELKVVLVAAEASGFKKVVAVGLEGTRLDEEEPAEINGKANRKQENAPKICISIDRYRISGINGGFSMSRVQHPF